MLGSSLSFTGAATFSSSATTNSNARYSVLISDTSSVASGNGGGIIFRGVYTGTTLVDAAGINTYKLNATDGDYAYGLNFTTRANGGNLTTGMVITPSGNIGIGTSSPSNLLTLNTVGNDTMPALGANGGKFGIMSGSMGFGLIIGVPSSGTATLQSQYINGTASALNMSLQPLGGNVGIGTTTPDQLVSIRKTSAGAETIALALQNIGSTAGTAVSMVFCPHENSSTPEPLAKITAYRLAQSNAPTDIIFYSYNAGMNERMRISYTGGIGAAGSSTNIYNPSDIRLKQNITTINYGLDKIKALNPVKYNWIDGFETLESDMPLLGFIAQEVQNVIPEAVELFSGNSITIGDTIIDNPLRVNEKFIIPVLVKAIQELSAEITILKNK